MPINLFDDGNVEIACQRCAMTTPKTIKWLRANDRYICPACGFESDLDRDKQIAGLDLPEA